MNEVVDSPGGINLEAFLGEAYGSFPSSLYLISVGDDRYACNNATLPDGQNADGLACFPDPDEATTYMGLLAGLNGDIIAKSFEEAREIVKSKAKLTCMFLFVGGKIVEVHYVK